MTVVSLRMNNYPAKPSGPLKKQDTKCMLCYELTLILFGMYNDKIRVIFKSLLKGDFQDIFAPATNLLLILLAENTPDYTSCLLPVCCT